MYKNFFKNAVRKRPIPMYNNLDHSTQDEFMK